MRTPSFVLTCLLFAACSQPANTSAPAPKAAPAAEPAPAKVAAAAPVAVVPAPASPVAPPVVPLAVPAAAPRSSAAIDPNAFNRLLAAPRRHEAPAADGAAGGFVEAFEIAASFEVDRNRLSFGTDLDPEQHFSFFTEAA